jgi:hypothetical protein
MMIAKSSTRTVRDRWADWAVVGVVAVALLVGWAVKAQTEGQRTAHTDSDSGLTVHYPEHWLLRQNDDLAFHAVDPGAGEFKTTYQVRVWPIDATREVTANLGMVLTNASLARAQEVTAYRLHGFSPGEEINGEPTLEASYVYVTDSSDPFFQRMPAVVLGLDVALAREDRVYVFSLLAADDEFGEAERAYRSFVESAEIE